MESWNRFIRWTWAQTNGLQAAPRQLAVAWEVHLQQCVHEQRLSAFPTSADLLPDTALPGTGTMSLWPFNGRVFAVEVQWQTKGHFGDRFNNLLTRGQLTLPTLLSSKWHISSLRCRQTTESWPTELAVLLCHPFVEFCSFSCKTVNQFLSEIVKLGKDPSKFLRHFNHKSNVFLQLFFLNPSPFDPVFCFCFFFLDYFAEVTEVLCGYPQVSSVFMMCLFSFSSVFVGTVSADGQFAFQKSDSVTTKLSCRRERQHPYCCDGCSLWFSIVLLKYTRPTLKETLSG